MTEERMFFCVICFQLHLLIIFQRPVCCATVWQLLAKSLSASHKWLGRWGFRNRIMWQWRRLVAG